MNSAITTALRVATRAIRVTAPKSFAAHFFRLGTVTTKLPNGRTLKLHTRGQESVTNAVFWWGWDGPEPEMLPIWWEHVSKAGTIIDVGAHIGHHSMVAALAGDAAVYSFEALPRIAERLEANIRRNALHIHVERKAVGEHAGRSSFYSVPSGLPSSSSLSKEFMSVHVELAETVVDVVALDDYFADRTLVRPVVLKIDTETTEPAVLRGAQALLRKYRPVVFVEVLPGYDTGTEVMEAVSGLDYRYGLLTDGGVQVRPQIVGDHAWRNWVLLPD